MWQQTICTTCSKECSKCGNKGHTEFSVTAPIPEKDSPTFACPMLDMDELQAHVRVLMKELPLTAAQQKNLRSSAKRRLAAMRSSGTSNGTQFATHAAQADLVDLAGLGGASSSPSTRTAEAGAAAAMDEDASRAAARVVSAYVSDTTHSSAAASVNPLPGVIADGVLAADRASTYTLIDAALSTKRNYSPMLNAAVRRVLKKVGVSRGGGATTDVPGSANPFFKRSEVQLRTAATRYTQQLDPAILTQVRDALTLFAIKRFFNRAGMTSGALTCGEVEENLVQCARESGLEALPVIVVLTQFVRELRMGTVNVE